MGGGGFCVGWDRKAVQGGGVGMPRYYCDYCDTYLTHDSPAVRKQHNAGYKHKANVRNYYMQFEESQLPAAGDARVKEIDARSREAFQAAVAANFMSGFGGPRPMGPPPVRPGAPAPRGPVMNPRAPLRGGPVMPGRPPFQYRGSPPGGNPPPMPFPGGPRPMVPTAGLTSGPRGDMGPMRGGPAMQGAPPHGHMGMPMGPPPQARPGMKPAS